jgi:hypothetical protein
MNIERFERAARDRISPSGQRGNRFAAPEPRCCLAGYAPDWIKRWPTNNPSR